MRIFSDELRFRLCFIKRGESFWPRLNKWWRRAIVVAGCIVLAWFVAWAAYKVFPDAMRQVFLFLHMVVVAVIPSMLVAYGIFLQRTPALSQHPLAVRFWVAFYAWCYIVAAVGFLMCQGVVPSITGGNFHVVDF